MKVVEPVLSRVTCRVVGLGRMWRFRLATFLLLLTPLLSSSVSHAQITPDKLSRDFVVKLFMKDSSEFYAVILAKPLPDRVYVQTRNGRLEIPLADIDYAIDYTFNYVMKEGIYSAALQVAAESQKPEVMQFLSRPRLSETCTVSTKEHDIYKGHRYLFDDSVHVILETKYGTLFFKYPELDEIFNYIGGGDTRTNFYTRTYFKVVDPRASQGYITPTARAFGSGSFFLTDYMIGGLQLNYGPTDWLSVNAGGLWAPFLPTTVTVATAGIKITPLQTDLWGIGAGVQGVYSEVVNSNHIGFPYVAATYGTWEGQLTILGGIAFQHKIDTISHLPYNTSNSIIAIEGDKRLGENIKGAVELFFISGFSIVPVCMSLRYFDNSLTVDAGVVFSLYESGAARTTPTLGQYVFNANFDIIPVVSASFHF